MKSLEVFAFLPFYFHEGNLTSGSCRAIMSQGSILPVGCSGVSANRGSNGWMCRNERSRLKEMFECAGVHRRAPDSFGVRAVFSNSLRRSQTFVACVCKRCPNGILGNNYGREPTNQSSVLLNHDVLTVLNTGTTI